MKKVVYKLLLIFVFFLGIININAAQKNPEYIEYENLTQQEKEEYNLIPNEYVVYYPFEKNILKKQQMYKSNNLYSAIPTSYDLRNINGKRLIPPIDNQGTLSLCWAFAGNNSIESYYLKNNKGTINLSENQPSYVATYLGDTQYGGGNSPYNTVKYWFLGHGPVSENYFGSYTTSYVSRNPKEYLDNNNLEFDIKDAKLFPSLLVKELYNDYGFDVMNSELNKFNQEVKQHIIDNGAIFAGIYWNDYFYNPSLNMIFNDGTLDKSYYNKTGHAVTIIGWDDNISGVSLKGNAVKGAWIAMNSWGNQNDYFYISYYDVNVVEALMGVQRIEEKTWNNSYTDYSIIESESNKKVFEFVKTNKTEKIESVKILFRNLDSTAKVSVGDGYTEYESITSDDIGFGLKTYEFTNAYFDSERVYVTVDSPNGIEDFSLALFTKSEETNKTLEIVDTDYNIISQDELYYEIVSQNIDTGTTLTINIYDDQDKNVTSNFTINKKMIINDRATILLNKKTSFNSDYSKYLKITVEAGDLKKEILNYYNGIGTKDVPYIIRKPLQFLVISSENVYFELGSDIDFSHDTNSKYGWFYNDGKGWEPQVFKGYFDGKGYSIKNLTSKQGGLFDLMENASFENVKLENIKIEATTETPEYLGIITNAMKNSSIISNVFINNSKITSNESSSAVVGMLYDGMIKDIHIKDSIINSSKSGIVASKIFNPTNETRIENVYSKNTSLTGTQIGAISPTIEISVKQANIKPITIKNNIINYESDIELIKNKNITVTDNNSYDVYKDKIIIESNYIKSNEEILNQTIFKDFDFIDTWLYDENETAFLKTFKKDFIVASDYIELNNYQLEDNLIMEVKTNTTAKNFISDILNINDINYKIYSKNNEISQLDIIKTGDYIEIEANDTKKIYYIIVSGDVNSDGQLSIFDIVKINNHIIDSSKSLEGAEYYAADFNGDKEISIFDIVKINNQIIGGN